MIRVASPFIGRAERRAVMRVLKSGQLSQGVEVAEFEKEFSQLVSGSECVAVNSGTSALHIALLAAGIGPGDEVIVPSFSFAATANAVCLTGATPVFGDIDSAFFNLDPAHTETLITNKTKAIMPVHLYGHPADLTALQRIADNHDLLLFEDAAQAVGATWHNFPVGTFGVASAFSFYPTKNMTTGEGGLIATSDSSVARNSRLLRNQGMEERYRNEIVGLNNRMTEIQAAIGRIQLKRLRDWLDRRQDNANYLSTDLRNVLVPQTAPNAVHAWHQYTIQLVDLNRERFVNELTQRGIGFGIYYPIPIHQLPSFNLHLDLPITRQVAARCISLPVHPRLKRWELDQIIQTVNSLAGVGA